MTEPTSVRTSDTLPPLPGATIPNRWFIHVSMLLAVVLIVGAISLSVWQWSQTRLPNTALVVVGVDQTSGVEVVIRDGNNREVARGILGEANRYRFVVLVEEGPYTMRATCGTQLFAEERVIVPSDQFIEIGITVPASIKSASTRLTRPTTLPSN